jgi:hypothetical protein
VEATLVLLEEAMVLATLGSRKRAHFLYSRAQSPYMLIYLKFLVRAGPKSTVALVSIGARRPCDVSHRYALYLFASARVLFSDLLVYAIAYVPPPSIFLLCRVCSVPMAKSGTRSKHAAWSKAYILLTYLPFTLPRCL